MGNLQVLCEVSGLKISEIFKSIQGEGIYVGTPTTFVRLALCNYACSWCDTKYSWMPNYSHEWTEMTPEKVLSQIGKDVEHVCFTGGEPMVQAEQLQLISSQLKERGHYLTVETNGSIYEADKHHGLFDFWTVSPKLSGSGMRDRLDFRVLEDIFTHEEGQLKFVVTSKTELNEILEILQGLDCIIAPTVLQPEWYTWRDRYEEALRMLVEETANWPRRPRVLPQLHKLIWGEKRGV
jgi:7-carboxy-7-deazaguanine synthase